MDKCWVNFYRTDYNGEVSPISVLINNERCEAYIEQLSEIDGVYSISKTTEPLHINRVEL